MLHAIGEFLRPQVLYLPNHGIIVKELAGSPLNSLLKLHTKGQIWCYPHEPTLLPVP